MSKARDQDRFQHMLPMLNQLFSEINPSTETTEYEVGGMNFLLRIKNDLVEFGLTLERPIFPTLAYFQHDQGNTKLLQFYVGATFDNELYKASEAIKTAKKMRVDPLAGLSEVPDGVDSIFENSSPALRDKILKAAIADYQDKIAKSDK